MQTIIADSADPITGLDFIALSLECMIDGSEMTGLRSWLLEELKRGGRVNFSNVSELAQTLVTVLRMQANQQNRQVHLAIAKLQTSLAAAQNNTRAYDPRGRFRPQAVYWPDPTPPNSRPLFGELPYAQTYKMVDKDTPIGSAGSCFAIEIAKHLKDNGFNYVVTEPNHASCAAWGIIFNTPSFRDLIQVAFGVRKRPRLLWKRLGQDGAAEFLDPFREDVLFQSVEEYEADYDRHIARAREALLKCKVFVITLGMNEIWHLASDGSALSRAPWRLAPHLTRHKVLTVEENVNALQTMLDIWRAHNPDLQLIVTVSPVPLHATFRADYHHVIAANQHSKSTLRVAAEEFCNRNSGQVVYFPSYEMVMNCIADPWEPDTRHVRPAAISQVMNLFETMFVNN